MYNKKALLDVLKKLDSAKAPAKKKDVDYVSKMGYRDDSPFNERPYIDIHTPNGTIDMSNTGQPIIANGQYLPPYSGMHQFDTDVVREVPLEEAKKGGTKKNKKYSKSLSATNKLLKKNPMLNSKKTKRKTYDPSAMYFQPGGLVSRVSDKSYYPIPPTASEVEAQVLNEGNGMTREGAERIRQAGIIRAEWESRFGKKTQTPQETPVSQPIVKATPPKKKIVFDTTTRYRFQDGGEYIEAELTPEEIKEYIRQGYKVEEVIPKAQKGLANIKKGLNTGSEFSKLMQELNTEGKVLGNTRNVAKPLVKTLPVIKDVNLKLPVTDYSVINTEGMPHQGTPFYIKDPIDYHPDDFEKMSLEDASHSISRTLSEYKDYVPDASQIGDFTFKQFSPGYNYMQNAFSQLNPLQRQITTDDFFKDEDVISLVNKQIEYNRSWKEFEEMYPEAPGIKIMRTLTGDTSRDELFSNLYPNVGLPNFRNKFLTPEQTEYLNNVGLSNPTFANKAMLNKTSLKSLTKGEDTLPRTYKELLDASKADTWLKTADPKMVVNEMRGVLGLKTEDINNATPEQLEKWRQQVVTKMYDQVLERWNRELENPFTAGDAYSKMSLNKYGGVPKAQTGLIKGVKPSERFRKFAKDEILNKYFK